MIANVDYKAFINWIITKGWSYIKSFATFSFIIFVALSLIDTFTGAEKLKQQYNGLIVTDKAGKSYMVRQTVLGTFKINEFDVSKMRLIE